MKKISLFAISIACLAFQSPIFANTCPSVDAIKKQGFDFVHPYQSPVRSWDVGLSQSLYDTQDTWIFSFVAMLADDETAAMSQAQAALPNLYGPVGSHPSSGNWICVYTAHVGELSYTAIAVTPPMPLFSIST